ncbi:efflux RND transporter permease subunit [Shigella flexneri]
MPPIRNRIDMLSTGIKSPIGLEVSGTVLSDIDATAQSIEAVAKTVPGVVSVLAERLEGGRYIDIDIDREKASRYGMTVGDVSCSSLQQSEVLWWVRQLKGWPGTLLTFATRRIPEQSAGAETDADPDPDEAANHAGRCRGY